MLRKRARPQGRRYAVELVELVELIGQGGAGLSAAGDRFFCAAAALRVRVTM